MVRLKDFELARKGLQFLSTKPEATNIEKFTKLERKLHTGLNEFVKNAASRSELFRNIAKGTLIAGTGLVAASFGLSAIAGEAQTLVQAAATVPTDSLVAASDAASSLINAGMGLLGAGAASLGAKQGADKTVDKAEAIRDSVHDYRHAMEEKALNSPKP